MMRILRAGLLVFLGFVLGLSNTATAEPVKADKPNHEHVVKVPSTVPAQAKRLHQVITSDPQVDAIANEYISFYKDYLTGEYKAFVSVYDPNAQYGWSECPVNTCGSIKLINGKVVLRLKSTEQRISAYYTYTAKSQPNVNNWNWDGLSIPLSGRMTWLGKKYTERFDYSGASVYNPAFPTPTYDPCSVSCGK